MRFRLIQSREDVVSLVEEIGFLPFFSNLIPGFSIEENIAPEYWFSAENGDNILVAPGEYTITLNPAEKTVTVK